MADDALNVDTPPSIVQRPVGRREWMKGAATLAGSAAAASLTPSIAEAEQQPAQPARRLSSTKPLIVASDKNAVVETTAGKVRGYARNGTQTFKGIPYAATTAGAGRFMPPDRPKPWTGLRSSMQYGPVSPQPDRTGWQNDESAFLFNWNDGVQGEDCLRLNIWTPALTDGRKRPVMVWLHGGGFVAGNGQEHPGYDGENLSRRGDVVVVSLNHRLGVVGYLNLAEYGQQYASSANVGNLDIVAALEWVRDNIANFGGDPGNVTIFGQSGGGGKVGTLMAMPSAAGLFHRAIIQSGSSLRQATPDRSGKLAAAVIEELGLSRSNLEKIHEVPYQQLVKAGMAALRKLQQANPPTPPPSGAGFGWGPTVDGRILPDHAFDPVAPAQSAKVPLMVGTVLNEFTTALGNPALEQMTNEELVKRVSEQYKDRAGEIIKVFRDAHPGAKPLDLFSRISAARTRQNAVTQATRKAAQGAAPAYLYWFTWQTPILDGRPRAFHCAEIAFAFYNTDVAASMTGGGEDARALAAKVSDAWINFARSGDPNHAGLPRWPAYKPGQGAVMIFDNRCEVKNDPDRAERLVLEQSNRSTAGDFEALNLRGTPWEHAAV
jgi:para-nitrobenzyl esterase